MLSGIRYVNERRSGTGRTASTYLGIGEILGSADGIVVSEQDDNLSGTHCGNLLSNKAVELIFI